MRTGKYPSLWMWRALYVANVLGIFLLWRYPSVLAICLLVLSIILLSYQPRFSFYLQALLWGTVLEVVAVYVGIWRYGAPSVLGVPFWIPIAWANMSMFRAARKNSL